MRQFLLNDRTRKMDKKTWKQMDSEIRKITREIADQTTRAMTDLAMFGTAILRIHHE